MFFKKINTGNRFDTAIGLGGISTLILLIFISGSGYAQQKNIPAHLQIHVLARAYGDSVVIRWAPGDAIAWKLCNDSGYHVTRIDYSNPFHPVTTVLTSKALLPMTLKQMAAYLDTKNEYAAIAAQAMYGNNFQLTKDTAVSFGDRIKQGRSAMNFRFSFAMEAADFSAPVAHALALRYVDNNVRKGGKYFYEISSPAANEDYVVDTGAVSVINLKEKKRAVPQGLKAYGFDRRVELHWNRRQLPGYDAYNIQRSDDGGKTWHVLNSLPFYSSYDSPPVLKKKDSIVRKITSLLRDYQVFLDSIPRNYTPYYYRISGLDAFGEQSPYTASVSVSGIDLTPPIPPDIDSIKNISGNVMEITWSQHQRSPDLAGYVLTRSNNAQGPFEPIIPKLIDKYATHFNDSAAVPHLPNYYVIMAIDSAGNSANSNPMVAYLTDSIPPAAPTGVAGIIDTSGVVHLHWNKNTEPDLKGYKVYYSYNPDYQFSQITHVPVTENEYTDTIQMKTLDRKVYYRVVAVDQNNNHSAYSAIAALQKPVVFPPTAPVPGNVFAGNDGTHIEWIESRSEGAAGYQIYRSKKGGNWQPIARLNQDWEVSSIPYTDTTIEPNTDYYYAAETIDSTGIHSAWSFAVHVRYSKSNTLPAVNTLKAYWDTTQKKVKLSWQYNDEGDYFFIIYRAAKDQTLVPWHSYDKGTQGCEDDELKQGSYQYAIKVVYQRDRKESQMSKAIGVIIPRGT